MYSPNFLESNFLHGASKAIEKGIKMRQNSNIACVGVGLTVEKILNSDTTSLVKIHSNLDWASANVSMK